MSILKLYLISQDVNNDYDTYDSSVVVAKNEEQARNINPCDWNDEGWEYNVDVWARLPSEVKVIEIGIANKDQKEGCVIIGSFNAG